MHTDVIPKYEELSDGELMNWTSEEFVKNFLQRAETFAEFFFHIDSWHAIELDEGAKLAGLVDFSERLAWREFYNGVYPPSKQIVALEKNQEDLGIVIRLAQQVIDEVKHQRVWSRWARHYGGSARLQDYKVSEEVIKQFHLSNQLDDCAEIAASQQCTSEVIVPYLFGYGSLDREKNIINRLLPADLREDLEDSVVSDEPRHIAVGRDIMIKYGGGAEKRRRLLELQNLKFTNTITILTKDLNLLGAERATPIPTL